MVRSLFFTRNATLNANYQTAPTDNRSPQRMVPNGIAMFVGVSFDSTDGGSEKGAQFGRRKEASGVVAQWTKCCNSQT